MSKELFNTDYKDYKEKPRRKSPEGKAQKENPEEKSIKSI